MGQRKNEAENIVLGVKSKIIIPAREIDDNESYCIEESRLILVVFTLFFVTFSMTTNRKNKSLVGLSGLFLLGYFVYGSLMTLDIISFPNNKVINFGGIEKWHRKHSE